MSKLTDYKVLTFDIYGTLIDWEAGVLTALQPLLASTTSNLSRKQLLDTYHECEATQQIATPDLPYSTLLEKILPNIAEKLGLNPPSEKQASEFGASVGSWPAFPDTLQALRVLKKHYKLVVLSNVDRVSFSVTNQGPLQGVPFDLIITAQDVGSYKPDPKNFSYMIREVGKKFGVGKEGIIQTAQSQFHDHQPAHKVGIKSAWIVRPGAVMGNREGEIWDWRFDTLGEMAEAVENAAAGQT